MLPSLLSILEKTSAYFAEKGIESPRLNAELLLSHLLKQPRLNLYLQFDRPMTDPELTRFREMARRRSRREPLHYITGVAFFRGLTLSVNTDVLIPRPETEIVVERALNKIQNLDNPAVLDFGTGSGCIALSIAHECPKARVIAADCSAKALELAKKNAQQNKIDATTIQWIQTSELPKLSWPVDLLVSNPPYIPSAQIEKLQPEVWFEPRSALDGGPDGLNWYRYFAKDAPTILKNKGWIILEIGDGQKDQIIEIFTQAHAWISMNIHSDLSGTPRVFEAQQVTGH